MTLDRITDPKCPPSQKTRWRVRREEKRSREHSEGGERAFIYIPTMVMRVNSLVKD